MLKVSNNYRDIYIMWREREREREVTTPHCLSWRGLSQSSRTRLSRQGEVQTLLEKCYIYYWKVLRLHKRRNGIILRVERESAQRRSLCLVFNLNFYRCNKSPPPPPPPSSLSSLNKIKTSFKHKTPPLHSPNLKLNRLGTKFIKI